MEKRPLTGTLSLRNGLVDPTLPGSDFDEATIAESVRWGNSIAVAVRRHMMDKPNRLGAHRINKGEAACLLRVQLNALSKGGAE